MSVEVSYGVQVTTKEVLETNPDSASAANRTIIHHLFNRATITLKATSTPPATKVAAWKQALDAGAATFDLDALTGANGANVDMTGLTIQLVKVKNLGANPLTIAPGDATPYNLLGATFKVILAQNQEFTFFGNDLTPEVGAGAKQIKLTGTLVETSEWIVVAG